ncbi:MAG: hypothetical protein KGK12_01365, partial [Armatimonadetes bacterium]|nr:hypothetical protein [Armatimonadota bacterium]
MSVRFRKQELNSTSRPGAHRGQTLIVALAVLFVLLIIGSLFVTEVARNLTAAGRSSDTQAAAALAEAGIRYGDQQLTQSEQGADWRPTPTGATNLTDPDYEWLAEGFTRVPMRGGRALIRVTYDPRPDNPRSQYIKIESIGRPGELGATEDPTVFAQQGNVPRLRSERVAYKQIGLTDYSLFITDKTRSGVADFLGWPAGPHNTSVVIGDPTTAEFPSGINNNHLILNGAVRCNADLNLGGDFFLYAGARGNVDSSGNPEPLLSNEGMYVAGNINLVPTRDVNGDGTLGAGDLQAHVDQIINYPGLVNNPATDPSQSGNLIRSSTDPLYSTHGGYVRDGSSATDVNGFTRDTPRLDPPSIDADVAGTTTMRYRALTRDSGEWITDANGNPQNTGLYGWGSQGIYVDNPADLQPETFTPGINGGYSLPREWLNPQGNYADGAWQGPQYRPPSVNVYLEGDQIVMVRDDGQSWLKPDGTPIAPGGASTITIPLSDAARRNHTFPDGVTVYVPPFPHNGDDPSSYSAANPSPYGDPNSYGVNVVIMLEGNVSVRGVYGAITDPTQDLNAPQLSRVHLTIVTGGTAYITGNLVKGDGYIDPNTHVVHSERNSTCAILAKDYVCVNTTLFNASESNAAAWSDLTPGSSMMTTEIGAQNPYSFDFSFGVDPTTYGMPSYVMLRHAAVAPGPSYLNMLINPALGTTTADGDNTSNYLFEFNNEPSGSVADPFDVPYAV